MAWIEDNPRFQAWAATAHERGPDVTGRRGYVDDDHAVSVNDSGAYFDLAVFGADWQDNPDGAGRRASEWFAQFFTPSPDVEGVRWEAGW